MKKCYNISFKTELDDADIKALNSCFYKAMEESMDIKGCSSLQVSEVTSGDLDNIFESK